MWRGRVVGTSARPVGRVDKAEKIIERYSKQRVVVVAAERVKLTIVMPAYQEEKNLESTVATVLQTLDTSRLSAELLIVNDGSTDRTPAIADELARLHPNARVVHQDNQGVGGACRTGILNARGEYVIIWPADMPMTGSDLLPFATNVGSTDAVVGCRTERLNYTPLMRFNSWLFRKAIQWCCGLSLRDVNWIVMFRRSLLEGTDLQERGIPMLSEILLNLRRRGARFVEIDSPMKPRTHGTPTAARFSVMWRTLLGLARICWRFHRFRRAST